MKPDRKAYTLAEILIVVTILSIIFIVGYRAIRATSREAVQLNRVAASEQKAAFDRFVGLLNDRLGQAWSYNLVSVTNGSQRQAYDCGCGSGTGGTDGAGPATAPAMLSVNGIGVQRCNASITAMRYCSRSLSVACSDS